MLKSPSASLLSIALALPAFAQEDKGITGENFFAICSVESERSALSFCQGYVFGFLEGGIIHSYLATRAFNQGMTGPEIEKIAEQNSEYCLPDGTSTTQVLDVAIKHMEEVPANRDLPAFVVIQVALKNAFPCPPISSTE